MYPPATWEMAAVCQPGFWGRLSPQRASLSLPLPLQTWASHTDITRWRNGSNDLGQEQVITSIQS